MKSVSLFILYIFVFFLTSGKKQPRDRPDVQAEVPPAEPGEGGGRTQGHQSKAGRQKHHLRVDRGGQICSFER